MHTLPFLASAPFTRWAATSEQEIKNMPLKQRQNMDKFSIVGSPKYDPWWLAFHASKRMEKKRTDGRVVVLFPKINEDRFTEMERREFKKFLRLAQGYSFLFKFHPRQLDSEKENFLKQYVPDGCQYVVTDQAIADICGDGNACAIVIGLTAASADILLSGGKMVEFYQGNYREGYYRCKEGYGSFLRWKECVPYAENAESLMQAVEGLMHGDLWQAYEGKFLAYVPRENHACEQIGQMLMQGSSVTA
jgi:hypothetical protein